MGGHMAGHVQHGEGGAHAMTDCPMMHGMEHGAQGGDAHGEHGHAGHGEAGDAAGDGR
jgi:hypothetical protein